MTQHDIDVEALAKLARLAVPADELATLSAQIPEILEFVRSIQEVPVADETESPEHRTIMREDNNPHAPGMYTEDLLNAAPKTKDGRVVVKQVVSRKGIGGSSA